MARADLSDKDDGVIVGGLTPIIKDRLVNDSSPGVGTSIQAGAVVTTSTAAPDVEAALGNATTLASIQKPIGIADKLQEIDLDTAFADNKSIRIIPLRSGTIVNLEFETNGGAVLDGDAVYLSDGANDSSAAGLIQLIKYTTPTTPNAAENELANEENVIAQQTRIGTAYEDSANDGSNTRWIQVKLD